ncbi:hypothetical protein D8674_010033 [Pyrus ussuriensis x Pyrus communis]|uniref:Uncharacterized protein n=1 Tax=Pyrus ussuriensis x Pyrus communis TaxID=2448454 RepID=A0A5N5FEV0_9ROSA|nr:hypothetical protein D8674_010033 [Pyrus ussuriensis x Pyrus communis]
MGNAKESILFKPFYVLAESFIRKGIFSYLLLVSLMLGAWSRRLHVYSLDHSSECVTAFVTNGTLVSGDDGNVSTGDQTTHDAIVVACGSNDCDVYLPNCDGEYDSTFAADDGLAGDNNGGACRTET